MKLRELLEDHGSIDDMSDDEQIEIIKSYITGIEVGGYSDIGNLIRGLIARIWDISNPSEKVQNYILSLKKVYLYPYIRKLSSKNLTRVFTDIEFVTVADQYDQLVKRHFANNSLLMNKWLRYAKNIREQQVKDDK